MPLEMLGICKAFGDQGIFEDFSLRCGEHSVTAVLGPSGCGKTSLLRMIAGLLKPDSGTIAGFDPESLSYVFQEPRLVPWLSNLENVALSVRDSMGRLAARERAERFLGLVGLSEYARRKPSSLSGGMRQRVSLARAFCRPAALLLMDEPFQSLDLKLRLSLMDGFAALWAEDPKTVVFVTHDAQEALYLGDEIVVLGTAPARILDRFPVPLRRGDRKLADPAMIELEKRLYRSLL